jgi:deazaflavin-dependent oxidoreductase (nitroreductase family)
MKSGEARRRAVANALWLVVNPITRPVAGLVPWWVILETRGRRSGKPRRVPLARGPIDGRIAWLISVHGETASFARNIESDPRVRLKIGGRWRAATASISAYDPELLQRFNRYARLGPQSLGIEPRLVRVVLDD